jgi:hypothetical protein
MKHAPVDFTGEQIFNMYFGGARVNFSSYSKFRFYYEAQQSGMTLSLSYGGSADDIYRYEFDGTPLKLPSKLSQILAIGYDVRIKEAATGKVWDYAAE